MDSKPRYVHTLGPDSPDIFNSNEAQEISGHDTYPRNCCNRVQYLPPTVPKCAVVQQASDFFRHHERRSVASIAVAQQPLRFFVADNLLRVWIEVYRPA